MLHPRRGLSTDFSSPWAPVVRSCKCVRLKEQMERNMGKGKRYRKRDGNGNGRQTWRCDLRQFVRAARLTHLRSSDARHVRISRQQNAQQFAAAFDSYVRHFLLRITYVFGNGGELGLRVFMQSIREAGGVLARTKT